MIIHAYTVKPSHSGLCSKWQQFFSQPPIWSDMPATVLAFFLPSVSKWILSGRMIGGWILDSLFFLGFRISSTLRPAQLSIHWVPRAFPLGQSARSFPPILPKNFIASYNTWSKGPFNFIYLHRMAESGETLLKVWYSEVWWVCFVCIMWKVKGKLNPVTVYEDPEGA